MHEFEEIIEEVGAFGPYQIRVFILVSAFETPAAWAMLLPVFAAATPTWKCPVSYIIDNGTVGNISMDANFTEAMCNADGFMCEGAKLTSGFTSIKSEVFFLHFMFSAFSICN